MAISELDTTYQQRLANPDAFILPTSLARSEIAKYGFEVPQRIGFVVLAFGEFQQAGVVACQPWMVGPEDLQANRGDFGKHFLADRELLEHHKNDGSLSSLNSATLDAQGVPVDRRRVTDQVWHGYVWPTSGLGRRAVLAIVSQNPSPTRDTRYKEKMVALDAARASDGPLEGHTLFIPQVRSTSGY